jgi:coenzyme Q-binding protein COQ10
MQHELRHSRFLKSLRMQMQIIAMSLLVATVSSFLSAPAISKTKKLENQISRTVVYSAKPETVYKAIQAIRSMPPRKLLSYKNGKAIIADVFPGLPVVGDTDCTYQETETSPTQIDYTMIESEKLSSFDGSWILTPQPDGKTKLTLIMATACHIPIPFVGMVVTGVEKKIADARLKQISEVIAKSHD